MCIYGSGQPYSFVRHSFPWQVVQSAQAFLATQSYIKFKSRMHMKINRVGQNRICTPYMTECMVIFLLKLPYVHRRYVYVWFRSTLKIKGYIMKA